MASNAYTSPSTSSPDSTATALNPPIQKSYSCVLCAQRKVKCDKAPGGCSNCTKARVQCIYKAPPPPRRRKKGVRDIDIHTRLRIYEDALRQLGINPTELENEELTKLHARQGDVKAGKRLENVLPEDTDSFRNGKAAVDAGVLVADEGKSRYLENGLWTSLRGEFRDSKELLDDSSDEEAYVYRTPDGSSPEASSSGIEVNILFGTPKSPASLRSLHPQPVQIFKLWQVYLDNINPLVKVFHAPTVQQIILDASSNLDDIPRNVEALLFAMYSISLSSLGDVECDSIMGEPRAVVTQRFRSGAQFALINAGFLRTSDITVLQALVLLLLSLQNYDGRIMWIFTGIAGRIAQRLGLHRDGEALGLPPFEVQIRRRLWWQILFIDGFAEKLAGIGGNVFYGDTKPPSNLNDSDLFQGMKELPKEHEGATEMMFFLIRCHVGEFLKRSSKPASNFDGVWNKLTTTLVSVAAKDKAIDELDALFHRKFIQYCDPSIPWHFLCTYLVKTIVFMMRFMARGAEQYGPGSTVVMSQAEKDKLFELALQIVSLSNTGYTMKEMQGFLWHANLHFQWKAFIYLISELRYRANSPEADNTWKLIESVYTNHPNLVKEVSKRALPVAVGNLTLKAWDAYLTARGVPEHGEPFFIQALRTRQPRRTESNMSSSSPQTSASIQSSETPAISSSQQNAPAEYPQQQLDPLESFQWDSNLAASLDETQVPGLSPLDSDQMNWSAWDSLLVDFQANSADNGFVTEAQDFTFGAQSSFHTLK